MKVFLNSYKQTNISLVRRIFMLAEGKANKIRTVAAAYVVKVHKKQVLSGILHVKTKCTVGIPQKRL